MKDPETRTVFYFTEKPKPKVQRPPERELKSIFRAFKLREIIFAPTVLLAIVTVLSLFNFHGTTIWDIESCRIAAERLTAKILIIALAIHIVDMLISGLYNLTKERVSVETESFCFRVALLICEIVLLVLIYLSCAIQNFPWGLFYAFFFIGGAALWITYNDLDHPDPPERYHM